MNHTNEFKNLASLHEANDSCDTWYVMLLPLLSLLFLHCVNRCSLFDFPLSLRQWSVRQATSAGI